MRKNNTEKEIYQYKYTTVPGKMRYEAGPAGIFFRSTGERSRTDPLLKNKDY